MSDLFAVYLLRILHIVIGVFWVGAVLLLSLFLTPSIRAAGPSAGPVLQQLMVVRALPRWLMAAAVLTLLSGLGLYWRDSGGFQSAAWLGSGPGKTFGLGGVLGFLAAVVGMAVNAPTARKMTELGTRLQGAGRAPTPEEQAMLAGYQTRLTRASNVTTVLLVLATLMMAVARYVP